MADDKVIRFGRWIKRHSWSKFTCSCCGNEHHEATERCPNPNCRARMTRVSTN